MTWRKENLWGVSVLQRVQLSIFFGIIIKIIIIIIIFSVTESSSSIILKLDQFKKQFNFIAY